MLVVMDEFGDTGLKFTQGSNSLMIIAAIVFHKTEKAEAVANLYGFVPPQMGYTHFLTLPRRNAALYNAALADFAQDINDPTADYQAIKK